MKTCNRSYEAMVTSIVARELGSPDIRLTPVPTYPDSVVYEATSGDRSIIFKGADPVGADRDGIALEAWACEVAGRHGVPVPAVLEVDLTRSVYPGSFFLMEKVEGVRLDEVPRSGGDFERIVFELGEALRRLHEVKLPGFGWLDEDSYRADGEIRGSYESWLDAVAADIPEALGYLGSAVLTPEQTNTLRAQVDAMQASLPGSPDAALLHGDFGQTHVYVNAPTSRITGVVDFGERAAGDWVWDLCEWEERSSLGVLLAGYGIDADRSEQIDQALDRYVLLKAVPWASKWHRRGEVQVIDWLLSTMNRLTSRGTA